MYGTHWYVRTVRVRFYSLRRLHAHSVVTVYLFSSAIIHCPLFQLKLTNTLSDCYTLRDRTFRILALLCMNSQKSPDTLANLAAT